MSVSVRDAQPDDVDGIARVHVQGWRESYAGFLSAEALAGLSVEERARMWRHAFAKPEPRAKFLVAEAAEGEIVGFARGGPGLPGGSVPLGTEAEIYAVYLLDKVKRRGIGRRLMAGVFEHLAAQGFASVGSWVLTGNAAAPGSTSRSAGGPVRSKSSPCAARPSPRSPTGSSRSGIG